MAIPHKHSQNCITLGLFFLSLLIFPSQLQARDVSFSWTANLEPVTGYKLYYKIGTDSTPPYNGTGLPEGDSPIFIEKITEYTVTRLSDDKTYFFTLTALSGEEESPYSVIIQENATDLPAPTITIITNN